MSKRFHLDYRRENSVQISFSIPVTLIEYISIVPHSHKESSMYIDSIRTGLCTMCSIT